MPVTQDTGGPTTAFSGDLHTIPAETAHVASALSTPATVALLVRRPAWLSIVVGKLDGLALLEENWDSYGGSRVDRKSVDHAREFISYLASVQNVTEPAVGGSPDGNVGFSWDHGAWSLDVEVLPCGRYDYVYLDERDRSKDLEASARDGFEFVERLTQWTERR